jgi:hypothetical protein
MHSEEYKNCTIRQKIAVVAAMIHGILFSLYGNCRDCRDKIRALPACSHFAGPKTSRLTIIKRQAILSTPYALRRLIPSHQHVLVDREI